MKSLLARGAWIEIRKCKPNLSVRLSLLARGAWIEISVSSLSPDGHEGRSSQEERGLKCPSGVDGGRRKRVAPRKRSVD